MNHFDVIIVGTGAGGGTLARHLAASGKRILLLERGGWLAREPQNWSAADVFIDNRYISADTWYDAKGKAFQPQIHYFVGGATKLYGAALYRLRREDFGELKHHDGVSPAWPIGYDDMEPYYTKAEQRQGGGPDRAVHQRPLPPSGGLPRAAHPAALRRPRRRRLPPVPRTLRRPARRGQPALQPLPAHRDLRRLPLPGPRQVRRRGAGRPPGP
jgi:choline dehydrogenase-like flavoprotein